MSAGREEMPLREALAALRDARDEADVVVTSMGSAREWMALGPLHPLDFVFVPSSMGQAPSLGLGLALAQPDRRIVAVNGDGSMLMNLGALVTITAERPANLVVVVCDNGVYEVTGQQPTAGAGEARTSGRGVDFPAMARACGFESVHRFTDAGQWASRARAVLDAAGPTFVSLEVEPVAGGVAPSSPGPAPARAREFMAAIRR